MSDSDRCETQADLACERDHRARHTHRNSIQTPMNIIIRFSVSEMKPSGTLLLPPTQAQPLAADILGCPGEQVNDGQPDGRFWDVAIIDEIDAMQSCGARLTVLTTTSVVACRADPTV